MSRAVAAVPERKSGKQVQYNIYAPCNEYLIASQELLEQYNCLNIVYKKHYCCYGTCKSDSRYFDSKIRTVFSPIRAYPLQDVWAYQCTLLAAAIVPNVYVMSFSHLCLGLPLLLFPATIPCIIVFSKQIPSAPATFVTNIHSFPVQ